MLTPCPECTAPTTHAVLEELGRCAACHRERDPELQAERKLIALAKAEQHAVVEEETRVEQERAESRGAREMVQQELARRELARRHLLPFVKRFNDGYDAGWVHKIICEELEDFERAVINKESPRLILEMPPRHGKSELVSRMFPAWFLGRNPKLEVIAASHTTSLAMDFSRKVRGVFRSDSFATVFRDARISPDSQAAEHWRTTLGGGYTAVGVGSAVVGKGASCFPAGTRIATPSGWVDIASFTDDNNSQCVYSYDTRRNLVTLRRPVAVKESVRDDLYRVEFRSGRSFVCTSDHPIYVESYGRYIPAALLAPGDRTVALQGMPAVQPGEDAREGGLLGVLHRGAKEFLCGFGLHVLRRPVSADALRSEEAAQTRARRRVLWSSLLPRASRGEELDRSDLRNLQQRDPQKTAERAEILFAGVQGDGETGTQAIAAAVRSLHRHVSAQVESYYILLESLRQRGALAADGGRGQLALQRRAQLRAVVRQNAPIDSGARWWPLPRVRGEGSNDPASMAGPNGAEVKLGHPSLRRRPPQQSAGELGDVVSDLPHRPPQVEADTVSRVVRLRGTSQRVYDIEVEGEHNFFAEGVLVHNCLLIDDPVSGAEDAESFNAREAIKGWYQTEAYTRLAPGGGVMIIMQRWHDEDLAGWLQARAASGEGEPWRVVRFPAIAEHDETYRKKGEPLHPSRYNLELLENIRRNMTMRQWEALYQQHPVPESGSYFEQSMFRFYDPEDLPPPDRLVVYSTWDLAIGQNEQNDYTAGFTAGLSESDDLYILDHQHGRWNAMDMVEKVLDDQKRWGSQIVGLEKGHIQMTLGPFLSKRMAERRQMGFLLHPMAVGRRDKQSRARSIQGRMQQGRVHWPRKAPWLAAAMRELMRFPHAQHDDRADALGHLGLLLDEMAPKRAPTPPKVKSWSDRLRSMSPVTRSSMSA